MPTMVFHLTPVRKARKVAVLLLLGAVVEQQFGRAQRIGDTDRRRGRCAAARQFHDHAGIRVRRELQSAILLGNNHREELVLDDVIPDFPGHIGVLVADLPVVQHPAQLFARAIQESLLFVREFRRGIRHQPVPVRHAREQFAFPPDIACFERFAFRIRHRRQHLSIDVEQRFGDFLAPEFDQVRHDHGAERRPQHQLPEERALAEDRVGQHSESRGNRRRTQVDPLVGKEDAAANEEQQPEKTHNKTGHARYSRFRKLRMKQTLTS
jgi:hypothetical protein